MRVRMYSMRNGRVECGVHTPRRLQQTTVSCKRSNCNKPEKILKVNASEVL